MTTLLLYNSKLGSQGQVIGPNLFVYQGSSSKFSTSDINQKKVIKVKFTTPNSHIIAFILYDINTKGRACIFSGSLGAIDLTGDNEFHKYEPKIIQQESGPISVVTLIPEWSAVWLITNCGNFQVETTLEENLNWFEL